MDEYKIILEEKQTMMALVLNVRQSVMKDVGWNLVS
jgi:hypothetical protein